MTPDQIRAARGLLAWSRDKLSAGVEFFSENGGVGVRLRKGAA